MSYSYKLKSHPTQSLYAHLTGVRDIALKTHKHHTIKPEIDDFIEIVCMCHDFGKGTTYFQRYIENEFNGIEKSQDTSSILHSSLALFISPWCFFTIRNPRCFHLSGSIQYVNIAEIGP